MAFSLTSIIILLFIVIGYSPEFSLTSAKTKSYGVLVAPRRSRRMVREALGSALGQVVRIAARTVEIIGEQQASFVINKEAIQQFGRALIAIGKLQRLSADSVESLLDDSKKIRDCSKQQLEEAETVALQTVRELEKLCQLAKISNKQKVGESVVPLLEARIKD